ncbi:hypothetical protein [Bdellovibrio sp.]|uniref:hypothetical protein n=1 Tax=Bdellovibrio sp. TaxID=28201 RepID=UPI003221BE08
MSRLILAIFTILVSLTAAASSCVPSDQSCDFYACKEREHSCGKKGYWQNFGYPYCQKFLKDEARFSPQSQIWLQDVRYCLQERIQHMAEGASCSNMHTIAMDSHVSCYVDTGFCDLSYVEQVRIYWYLKGALRSTDTWREAYLLKQACFSRFVVPR